MQILDGKKLASEILDSLKREIETIGVAPRLGVILVGRDEASKIYVSLKEKVALEIGIDFCLISLSENISEEKIINEIEKLNQNDSIDGIIVQLPLPKSLNKNRIINTIKPEKDVDGFHPENIKKFFSGKETFLPVFPEAIWELIKFSGEKLENKKAIIICNSDDFGKAMQETLKKNKVISEYFFGVDLKKNIEKINKADIIITACGKSNLISGEMIKNKSILIDGGIVKNGKRVVGDIDFESVKNLEGFVSPVPGGVGPLTIACLLRNVFWANKKLSK